MRRTVVIALVAAMLAGSAALLGAYPASPTGLPELLGPEGAASTAPEVAANEKLRLSLSEEGYFYNRDIQVAITASVSGAKIYYTTDGSEPTSAAREYTEPLEFSAAGNVRGVVVKAIAVYEDTITRPVVHTYFLGKDVDTRFDTLVFSLSTDEEYLYDYDTGIFVTGRLRDEYLAQNPGHVDPPAPANFNLRGMEGERPIYVEAFTPDGQRVVAQAAGVRLVGGWSRADSQKSLKLIARKRYEPGAGNFNYNFFPGETAADTVGTPLMKYDSIVLRNGGNDRNFAMLRHETGADLARQAGFRAVTPMRAAAVFLNGEYYGFSWLQLNVHEQYLQDVYSAPDPSFDIVENSERKIDTNSISARQGIEELNSYASKDLTNDETFAELEAILDIDNFLWYYAYEIYVGNDDWPHNNLKRWRYTGASMEELSQGNSAPAPELDGRWRYFMFDLDWALGLYGDSPNKTTFQNVLGSAAAQRHSPMLKAVLQRPDMAEKFTMILCDILSNVVTPDNVQQTIDKLYAEAEREISQALAANKYGWASTFGIEQNHSAMVSYARKRGAYILSSLKGYFGYEDATYTVRVTGGEAVIGTQKGTEAQYFTEISVPVSPSLGKFEVFDHWELNGKTIYEPDITVSTADISGGDAVEVKLVTRTETPALVISDVYAESKRNGCVLTNTTDKTVSTQGLFLSDTTDNLFRFALPAAKLAPGETLVLVGKGSADKGDLLKIQMNFNVKAGEVVTLTDETGKVLDFRAVEG